MDPAAANAALAAKQIDASWGLMPILALKQQKDEYYLGHLQEGVQTTLKAKLIKCDVDVKQWQNAEFVERGIQQLNYVNY